MEEQRKASVLAIDLGASSGRAMLGRFDGTRIELQEIHRFSNDPVLVNGTMYWDILRIFHEIKVSLIKVKLAGGIDSLSVDAWGVDFGLLSSSGQLLENPVHYRDSRTTKMPEKVYEYISPDELYRITGNQIMEINTLFQLMAVKEQEKWMLNQADKMLMTPDLFHYFLTGKAVAELSIASTTQMLDPMEKKWAGDMIERLGLPKTLFPTIVPSGTVLGKLKADLCEELNIEPCQVIAGCGHDTQCAMVAAPADEKDFIFLSCGTWSLLGTELDAPVVTTISQKRNLTNESGYNNKVSFLKNITGLWLLQESRRQWIREGREFSFGELESMAIEARPFQCYIDTDDPVFAPSGDMPERIREYCKNSGQVIPSTEGEIVRCINESLAMKYRKSLEEIMECTGKDYQTIHMVGGGTKSHMLCQMTADACHVTVTGGPVEASVLGNMAIQLMAVGTIQHLEEARKMIKRSEVILSYQPSNQVKWESEYRRFLKVTG